MPAEVPPSPRPSAPPVTLAPVLEFLAKHAPFSQMAAEDLAFMAERLKLGFYAAGDVITGPEAGPADRLYVIKQGRVRGGTDAPEAPEEGTWELLPGEAFPIGALLGRRPVRFVQRAVEDTFCLELDREAFDALRARSPEFQDFCARRLTSLLDQALRGMQASLATRVANDSSLNTPLRALVRREPVTCWPGTAIREVLGTLEAERVGSIVVTDGAGAPLGLFTLHDLLSRVALKGVPLDAPIDVVMTPEPAALTSQSLALEAALLMASHGFRHVLVVDDGRLAGVLSERDLFSLQRVGIANLSRTIVQAADAEALAAVGGPMQTLVDQMLAQGVSVEQLAQIITLLNDQLTRRVVEICRDRLEEPLPPFTWLAFGSEGRREQTLKTDQDNGILFVAEPGADPEGMRQRLLVLARAVNQTLADLGYPLCPGNIMASNPRCCLSLEEWRRRFDTWVEQGTPEHLLNAAIFFDLRPVYGDAGPVADLLGWLASRVRRNARFLRQMAENALGNRPPLGLVRDFVVTSGGEHPHTIDLKVQGATVFVDGARLFALASGVSETNTPARLRAAVVGARVRPDEAEAWCDAYAFIQLLRMRHHRAQQHAGVALDNHVDPDALNELDRRILREAFRQARKLQARIALDYHL
jgi:CBS domain-containing protein